MTLADKLSVFQALKDSLPTIIGESMANNQEAIVNLNIQQMTDGLNAEGSQIGEYHNIGYALNKNKMNPKAGFGNVDLRFQGSFQERMYLIVNNSEYDISSMDAKTNKLIGQYGDIIFGLMDENKERVYEIIHPDLLEKVAEITGCEIV